MLKTIWMYILNNIFKIKTETKQKEIENNQKYAVDYERINDINFNAIFSNKLANYVVNDSTINIDGDNKRTDLLNLTCKSMWKKMKKITSMSFGTGGIILVPYVKGGKLFYNLVPQNRLTIDKTDGETITGATVLAEKRTINNGMSEKVYYRWTNYSIENNTITILQQFSDEKGNKIPTPDFWANITEEQKITGVDRVLFGYIKSPVNNRRANDKYGVPITYGCEATIMEIKETMAQIVREYELKETFVGADITMFNGENGLPKNGLYRKIDAGKDDFFEVFDPQFRDYTVRLQELYKRLEHEIGTSYGVLSEVSTKNATATEIKRSMYDTFTIVDDMRTSIEKGVEDFIYACNVLANAYNLSANGDYSINYDWSYSLLEDNQEQLNQLLIGIDKEVISNVELRQWLKPNETEDEAKQHIIDIQNENKANEPSIKDILNGRQNNIEE